MAKQKLKKDESITLPIDRVMKKRLEAEADREERSVSDMGRILWREALDARDAKRAEVMEPALG